jgi:hypothetical protein
MAGCRYQHSPYRHFLLDNGRALLAAQGLRGQSDIPAVFCMIFHKLYRKHAQRITAGSPNKRCPFSFFDVKGWLMMAFMIALGITIRTARLLPESFIAVFYTGLSLALMATGGRFILLYWKRK